MAVKDKKQILEQLASQRPEVWMGGEKWPADITKHPVGLRLANYFIELWEWIYREFPDTSIVKSDLINEDICAWHALQRKPEDYIQRMRIQREACRRYVCILKCAISDWINGLWAATYETDQAKGTEYHQRFQEWVKHMQKNDFTNSIGIVDARGDRGLAATQQPTKDAFIHIVERKKDGIVVAGAKANTSLSPVVNEILVTPAFSEQDWYNPSEKFSEFAVSFAVPMDTKGIKYICRPAGFRKKKFEMDYPLSKNFAWTDSITVFDNVFVPWDRVFLCGEWDCSLSYAFYPGLTMHQYAKAGCKAGGMENLIGAAKLVSHYNGSDIYEHVKDRITDMAYTAEMSFSCGIACAYEGSMHPSGVWIPDTKKATIPKYMAYKHAGESLSWLIEMAGGLIITGPGEEDWKNPEERAYLDKALYGKVGTEPIERAKAIKLAEDLACTEFGGFIHTQSVLTGGTAREIKEAMALLFDFDDCMETAKVHAGIQKEDNRGFTGMPGDPNK